jgi:glycerol-3-phosphate acyltransferase PlsY
MDPLIISNVLLLVGAYLIGSIPFAIIVTRLWKGTDVRAQGSGHAGATNTMRAAGWLPGIMVMVLDIAKGGLIAWLAIRLESGSLITWLAVALGVAGHCWPIFAGFRGGMGLATAGGALLIFWPLGFVLGIGLAAGMQLVVRHSARANIATALGLAPLWLLFGASTLQAGAAFAASVIIGIRASTDWNRVYHELWLDRQPEPPE